MIRKKQAKKEIVIDLTGPDGNAFSLMAHARSFGRQLGFSKSKIDNIINDMMKSDYEHLLQVFDKHFGNIVILER